MRQSFKFNVFVLKEDLICTVSDDMILASRQRRCGGQALEM